MNFLPPTMHPDWWTSDLDVLDPNYTNIHGIRHDDVLAPHLPFTPQHILEQYISQRTNPKSTIYRRPWVQLHNKTLGGVSTVKADKDQFHAVLDIQQFRPEEITVKVVDKFVVVEGKHEEKQDEHGFISRQFTRKYLVPEQCDLEQVKSSVSSDGILTITAPRKHDPKHREKLIRIEMTGKPLAREILEAQKEEKKSEKK